MDESMMDKANELLRQGKFAEAGKIFRQLWEEEQNPFAASRYLYCLRKAGYAEAAIKQANKASAQFPDNIYIQREFVWSFYDSVKNYGEKDDLETTIKLASNLLKINPEPLPLELTIMAVIKLAKEQNKWQIVYEWCQKITASQFGNENQLNNSNKKGKSNREIWYFAYLKSLINLNYWSQVKKVALEASKIYPKEINFLRWYGLSLANLGDIKAGIAKLEDVILKNREEWYLFQDLAELYLQINQKETAFRYLFKAALSTKDDKIKVTLYQKIAAISLTMNNLEMAAKHIQLSKLIRQEERWKIKTDLLEIETNIRQKYADNNLNWVEYSLEELKKDCQTIWQQESYQNLRRYLGIIHSLPKDKPFAWIKSETGETIFCLQKDIPPFLRRENQEITFVLEKNWNQKKNELSTKAVNIQKFQP